MSKIREFRVSDTMRLGIENLVHQVFNDCPGESEYRYISRLDDLDLSELAQQIQPNYVSEPALLVTNLPSFPSVQQSKILALMLGESIGKCVAYSDYNQSYITDIRPTTLSKEASSGTTLLRPHSDLAFADDDCRPRDLVLVPHKAEGDPVKTLVGPAHLIDEALSAEERLILREPIFEVVSGMKLAWRHLRVTRLAVLAEVEGRVQIRHDLGGIRPARDLDTEKRDLAERALRSLEEVALHVSRAYGVAVAKGQALFIANYKCLHGRAELDTSRSSRLLLRAYVVAPEIVRQHRNRMIALGH